MKKQTVSDIRRSEDKLTSYAMTFDVAPSKDMKGAVHKRRHIKGRNSRELEEAVYKWYVQQRSVSVNVRGLDIADAANKLPRHVGIEFFKASDVVVVSSPHQSPRCGVSRFRSAQSITIPLSVWSVSISPAH